MCHGTFVFGDHGMTADGNHGGGTTEETTAGLYERVRSEHITYCSCLPCSPPRSVRTHTYSSERTHPAQNDLGPRSHFSFCSRLPCSSPSFPPTHIYSSSRVLSCPFRAPPLFTPPPVLGQRCLPSVCVWPSLTLAGTRTTLSRVTSPPLSTDLRMPRRQSLILSTKSILCRRLARCWASRHRSLTLAV